MDIQPFILTSLSFNFNVGMYVNAYVRRTSARLIILILQIFFTKIYNHKQNIYETTKQQNDETKKQQNNKTTKQQNNKTNKQMNERTEPNKKMVGCRDSYTIPEMNFFRCYGPCLTYFSERLGLGRAASQQCVRTKEQRQQEHQKKILSSKQNWSPHGDQNCAEHVRWVKRIQKEI